MNLKTSLFVIVVVGLITTLMTYNNDIYAQEESNLITNYEINVGGGTNNPDFFRSIVTLYNNDIPIGQIGFYDVGLYIPEDYIDDNGFIFMHLPVATLPAILDVLNNFKPAYLYLAEKAFIYQ
ncbi:MAG: hypothetical protein ACPKPY_12820 [Nitrososphaeraceae archaeon]